MLECLKIGVVGLFILLVFLTQVSEARESTATLLVRLWVVPDMTMFYEDTAWAYQASQAMSRFDLVFEESAAGPVFLGSEVANNTYLCRHYDAVSQNLIITQTEI